MQRLWPDGPPPAMTARGNPQQQQQQGSGGGDQETPPPASSNHEQLAEAPAEDPPVVVEEEEEEFPLAELARLDEMINRPRWVVPVLAKGELEVLLEASIRLCRQAGGLLAMTARTNAL
ncbi:hypothetical protein HPB51_019051 [Rhipicephalus microplus]|uniref:Uncharacterized protein n=1 Tax=Rhipicephalus microplus TaxID=6941 RepID=A0A9J6D6M4_RHIMP|nr:hypothetical protein HPB51_019051 [Rhipicephalus microplus]